jgi:hypothetical protein
MESFEFQVKELRGIRFPGQAWEKVKGRIDYDDRAHLFEIVYHRYWAEIPGYAPVSRALQAAGAHQ